jgi:hypothetical protein
VSPRARRAELAIPGKPSWSSKNRRQGRGDKSAIVPSRVRVRVREPTAASSGLDVRACVCLTCVRDECWARKGEGGGRGHSIHVYQPNTIFAWPSKSSSTEQPLFLSFISALGLKCGAPPVYRRRRPTPGTKQCALRDEGFVEFTPRGPSRLNIRRRLRNELAPLWGPHQLREKLRAGYLWAREGMPMAGPTPPARPLPAPYPPIPFLLPQPPPSSFISAPIPSRRPADILIYGYASSCLLARSRPSLLSRAATDFGTRSAQEAPTFRQPRYRLSLISISPPTV